jgi:alpha-D-xyloside xylohydrolase
MIWLHLIFSPKRLLLMIASPKKVLILLCAIAVVTLLTVFTITSFKSPNNERVTKLEDGVVVTISNPYPGGASQVKLQAITDNIIHVTAGITDSFSTDPSLMVIDKKVTPKWDLVQDDDQLVLKTAFIKATLSKKTGDVIFTDLSGKLILKEVPNGGKSFKPKTIGEDKTNQVCQTFEAAPDEAFYGLGQHQNGQFNYRGEHVTLLQQNSVAGVPFLVSSKNYGILWDNYSITRFGDCRSFQPLATLLLFDASGNPGGLTASYTSRKNPGDIRVQRVESEIEYEFLQSLKKLPSGFSLNDGLVQWEGSVASGFSGEHKFLMTSGGYIKMWLDGKLLVDKWRQCWNPASSSFSFNLEKGKKVPIKIEWIPDGGESFLSLKWLSPIAEKDLNKFAISSDAGDNINYYFVYGKNMDEVISGYRDITGRATMLPKWALGFWQSRERYKTQDELVGVVKEFRKRKIPIDNIVQDWFYWKPDQWGSHEFDPSRFPDPDNMIKDLHEKYNAHFMISVWPKFYVGTKNYDLFNSKGWLYKQNVLNKQKDWVGYVSTFYDAYNPQARDLFWQLMNEMLYKKGVDAWWMDATEPDILSNTSIEERMKIGGPTALGPTAKYFNAYALENARGVYEGQRKEDPSKRVFILTRSSFGGLQRYAAATWSGDVGARWTDLGNQVTAGINFSMSGLPYWTMDIGGFAVERRYENAKGKDLEEWREQTTRWYQFGAFCPLFRSHGQFPFREIYNIAPDDHPAYKSMLYYDQLRYRLMPYIYSVAGKTYHDNYTIMRGLVMDFPNDTAVRNIGDQYMFGPALLVNPVYEFEARTRQLYLPAGTGWYDFYSGKYYTGAQTIHAAAPYERIPLFVKEGSIVPVGPDLQYMNEKPADPITLFVYTGSNGSFTLYEDGDTNNDYEQGKFAGIPFNWNETLKTLTIGDRKGSFDGMLMNRTFRIVWVNKKQARGMEPDRAPDKVVAYTGKSISIKYK